MHYHIRWMISSDLPEVLKLEPNYIQDELIKLLRQRNTIGMVVEHDEKLVGFMIYSLHKSYLSILNMVGINDDVYTSMINKLKNKLSLQRRKRIVWNIGENYEFAGRLKNHGFRNFNGQMKYIHLMDYSSEIEQFEPFIIL